MGRGITPNGCLSRTEKLVNNLPFLRRFRNEKHAEEEESSISPRDDSFPSLRLRPREEREEESH